MDESTAFYRLSDILHKSIDTARGRAANKSPERRRAGLLGEALENLSNETY